MLLRYKCHFCQTMKPGLHRCGQCLVAIYCDKRCQSASWPARKQHCHVQLLNLTRSLAFHPAPATTFKAIQRLARIHMDILAELLLPTLCTEHIPNRKDRSCLGWDLMQFQKSIESNIGDLHTFAMKLDIVVGDNQNATFSFISQKRSLEAKWVKAVARGLDIV
ncbi:hypothetical protein BDR06DRAFT_975497 [Suillus hirtellus]|nr:hypothetical protein BDR06DRAFT_975497 [Suillus hirtellus]